jgi:hypothetical protein
MSIENGERLIRMMKADPDLAERVAAAGAECFEQVSEEAGASATAYDVVAALVRELHATPATG